MNDFRELVKIVNVVFFCLKSKNVKRRKIEFKINSNLVFYPLYKSVGFDIFKASLTLSFSNLIIYRAFYRFVFYLSFKKKFAYLPIGSCVDWAGLHFECMEKEFGL